MSGAPSARLRVLVTRPVEQAAPWLEGLAAAGHEAIAYPTITVGPPPSWAALDEALLRLTTYEWLIFTSATAVKMALSRLPAHLDPGALDRPLVAAVGAKTAAALEDAGFRVVVRPEDQRQEGLTAALASMSAGARVLFPQAVGGRGDLAEALRARGCIVDVVSASTTCALPSLAPPPPFDVATFASPSALRAFVDAHGTSLLAARSLIAIGPTTAATAREVGLDPTVAEAPSIEALLRALTVLAATTVHSNA